jgi:hypothetical protein
MLALRSAALSPYDAVERDPPPPSRDRGYRSLAELPLPAYAAARRPARNVTAEMYT